jgi:hypothetical protein
MDSIDINHKILDLKEKLSLFLLLDEYMRKDPVYQARCSPSAQGFVEANWNLVQINIIKLEEKIEYYESLLKI